MPENTGQHPSQTGRYVLTVGHSNHPMPHFIDLLMGSGVQVVVDIRSSPHSRHAPQFDQVALADSLGRVGLKYLYLGRELGGRPRGRSFYDSAGHVLYNRVAEAPEFEEGIARLQKGIGQYKVAILCSEENPAACHRRLLVGRVLFEKGYDVEHIRGDGTIVPEEDFRESEPRGVQQPLFDELKDTSWKSIPSVSPKKRRASSSGF